MWTKSCVSLKMNNEAVILDYSKLYCSQSAEKICFPDNLINFGWLIMVIELSGVQFGLESQEWF